MNGIGDIFALVTHPFLSVSHSIPLAAVQWLLHFCEHSEEVVYVYLLIAGELDLLLPPILPSQIYFHSLQRLGMSAYSVWCFHTDLVRGLMICG